MKHQRSSSSDLSRIVGQNLLVADIAEPLASFDETCSADSARAFMEDRGYDLVGVRSEGIVKGFVRQSSLNGGVLGDHEEPFEKRVVLSGSEGLREVFDRLETSRCVFVRTLQSVDGIVTRGDLQKAGVRMWLFGLVSLIEMQMLKLIRTNIAEEAWRERLTPNRVKLAEDNYKKLCKSGLEIDLAYSLQWCDKREIILRVPKLFEQTGIRPRKQLRGLLRELENLRDHLAHSQDIVSTRWPRLVSLVSEAETLLKNLEAATTVPG